MSIARTSSSERRATKRDAWRMAHPEFPKERPTVPQAVVMGLKQSAQSWHVQTASTQSDCVRLKQIIVTECTNAALVSALFITCTAGPALDVDGMPSNGMSNRYGMTNLYYSFFVLSSMLFAMSIIYSITLLIIVESMNPQDVVSFAHSLGIAIHWPLHHFIAGILLLLGGLLLKSFWDVSLWTWISGIAVIMFLLLIYVGFLAVSVQVQWDIMDANLAQAQDPTPPQVASDGPPANPLSVSSAEMTVAPDAGGVLLVAENATGAASSRLGPSCIRVDDRQAALEMHQRGSWMDEPLPDRMPLPECVTRNWSALELSVDMGAILHIRVVRARELEEPAANTTVLPTIDVS